jgi:hypothetical protein
VSVAGIREDANPSGRRLGRELMRGRGSAAASSPAVGTPRLLISAASATRPGRHSFGRRAQRASRGNTRARGSDEPGRRPTALRQKQPTLLGSEEKSGPARVHVRAARPVSSIRLMRTCVRGRATQVGRASLIRHKNWAFSSGSRMGRNRTVARAMGARPGHQRRRRRAARGFCEHARERGAGCAPLSVNEAVNRAVQPPAVRAQPPTGAGTSGYAG